MTDFTGATDMSKFCVFTPTYNRESYLPRLYESLVAQTYTDFTWLIIDDGSTDGTKDLVKTYIDAGLISIVYRKVINGGKQRAQNIAVEMCRDELFLCVDSDDWLVKDALQVFSDVWDGVKDDPYIAGMICPRQVAGSPTVTMPESADTVSAWDLYESYGFSGDALHVYRTEVISRHPLPVASGEKFISEWYSVNMIAKTHHVKVIHRALQMGEYLPGGYSDRARILARENPVSYCTNKRLCIEMSKKWRNKTLHTILYLVGCFYSGRQHAISSAPYPILAMLCYIPALIVQHFEFDRA